MITREEAHDYMWRKNDECPYMRWQNHSTIRDYVDLMIDDIYDSFEQHIKSLKAQLENTEQLTCESCEYKYIVSYDCTECRHNDSPIDYLDLECFPDFGCIFHKPKDTK